MERKIGEIFEFEGKKLKVVETEKNLCFDCYFYNGVTCQKTFRECGKCEKGARSDYKPIIFVEVKDEQPQELNLCEVLEHCPKGEQFWSPLFGYVKLHKINQEAKKVVVISNIKMPWDINNDGTMLIYGVVSSEIMLFPSKEQRDWTKVKYEPKKERFDPKKLKAFDKVLVRNVSTDKWGCSLFSNINVGTVNKYHCVGLYYKYCIPYNDETKHLVGTTDEAPGFYRYWEE